MISFAQIMGGTVSTSGLTEHLMNNTLTPEQAQMAAYYQRGAVIDGAMLEAAQAIADGEITFSEALAEMVSDYIRAGRDIDGLDAYELRMNDRLLALALRIAEDRENGTDTIGAAVAVIRPDIHPLVARGLGIEAGDILSHREVDALLAGRTAANEPIEGKTYAQERRLPVNPKTGKAERSMPIGSYDFTISPHKSISVAWAMANDLEKAKIYNCFIEAVRETAAYLEDRLGRARIGDGGKDGYERGHIATLEFTHHTARKVTQTIADGVSGVVIDAAAAADPDLHTHLLIPNAVFCESGRVGSLDTAGVRGFIFEADAFCHARLATKLRDAGFDAELDERTGAAMMPAIPAAACDLYSKRTKAGEAVARKVAADKGEDWDALTASQIADRVKSATQGWEQKEKGGKDEVADIADWQRQAKDFGWDVPKSFLAYGPPAPERSQEVRHREALEIARERLSEKWDSRSVLTHHELRTAAFQGLIHAGNDGGIADADAVTKLMREEGVLQYGERTQLKWGQEADKRVVSVTTGLHEAQELEFIELARSAAADRSGSIPREMLTRKAAESGLDFSDEHGKAQRSAMERLAYGGRLGVLVGTGGSGKTTLLRPMIAAWQEQGREVWGTSLASRQSDALEKEGIDPRRLWAFPVLVDKIKTGEIKLDRNSVVAVDEWGMIGTRQGLELLRLREKHGFSVVAVGDDKQLHSIDAGAIYELCRRALGPGQIPEITSTKRQQTDHEKKAVKLLRDGEAAQYLAMKQADGTAELVPGRAEDVIARTAQLYAERWSATGTAPSISAPTNQDAHLIGQAVRLERRKLGLVGPDLMTVRATDGERQYPLTVAHGDKVRLHQSTGARYVGGGGGPIGRNGHVLEVQDVSKAGITLKSANGKVGFVKWDKLADKATGRTLLSYGDCQTIHTAQGSTADTHIAAFPHGSKALSGGAGYSDAIRHAKESYLLTSALAEYVDVKARRPRNDIHEVTDADRWANVAGYLIGSPPKDLAVNLAERTGGLRSGTVRSFHDGMQHAGDAAEHMQQQRAGRSQGLGDAVREMGREAAEMARQAMRQAMRQAREAVRGASRQQRDTEHQRHHQQEQECDRDYELER